MKKTLNTSRPALYYIVTGLQHNGPNPRMTRYSNGLYGNCSGLSGDCSWLSGDCSGLSGDVTMVWGNCTGLWGNLNDCEITEFINILELVR